MEFPPIFEWQRDPPPGGLVSVTVRLNYLEAADLVAGGDSTAVGEAVAQALQAAVADGSLTLE